MSNCGDLCTAAKCQELERRIEELEDRLNNIRVDLRVQNNQLYTFVYIGDRYGFDSVELPVHTLDIEASFNADNFLRIDINNQQSRDFAIVEIPIPEIPEVTEHIESNLKLSGLFESDKLYLTVADGESHDTAVIDIPHDEPNLDVRLFSTIFQSNGSNVLAIEAHVNDSSDQTRVELPAAIEDFSFNMAVQGSTLGADIGFNGQNIFRSVELPVFEPFVVVDVFNLDDNSFVVKVSVNGNSDEDNFTLEIPDMDCDELEEKLDRCCSEITDLLSSLSLQLTNTESILNQSVNEVKDYVTVDVAGEISSGVCEIPVDENNEILPEKQSIALTKQNYSGQGFVGLNNALTLIEDKLTAILTNTCAAIEPDHVVDLREFAKNCSIELPERSQFSSDSTWFEAVKNAITGFGAGTTLKLLSKSLKFTPGSPVTFAVTATASYVIKHLLDQTFSQENIAYNDICQKLGRLEDPDVVSLVASPKYITNIEDKVLVLHFVTMDNYPKRQRGSYPRQIQIPAARESYSWINDFLDLRWITGNQYAELELKGYKAKVSGWFKDAEAANNYFDAVLNLTTATEKNRNIPNHSNPRTDIITLTTRPHRAFIESVNDAGIAICHVKYVPVKPE